MMKISVIICTHNPKEEYLQKTLRALRDQSLPGDQWELLLVDNASDAPVEGRFDISWHANGRVIVEPELGLTPARLRGIKESRGEILIFVDDDNLLAEDYLGTALGISASYPFLGAWGGNLVPMYETPPQGWALPHVAMLAVRNVEKDVWSNIPEWSAGTCPAGAGMCIRSSVAMRYADYCKNDPRRAGMDRKGNSLISSGDLDMAYTASDAGMGMGLFPNLSLTHIIPSNRLELDYLLRLSEANGISNVLLASFRGGSHPSSAMAQRTILGRARDRLIELLSRKGKNHRVHRRFREAYNRGIGKGQEMIRNGMF